MKLHKYNCYIRYNSDNLYINIPNIYESVKDVKKYDEKHLSQKLFSICNKYNICTLEIKSNKEIKKFSNFYNENINISWTVITSKQMSENIKNCWIDKILKNIN